MHEMSGIGNVPPQRRYRRLQGSGKRGTETAGGRSKSQQMNADEYERKKRDWKDQTWRVGNMLHVGLTDSHVHEGLLNGVVVGHIVVFWHHRQKPLSESTVRIVPTARREA